MESADRGEGTTDPPTVSWEQAVRARIAAGVRRGGRYAWRLLQAWRWDAWDVFQRKGYLLIATLVAAYVGLYSVMEARHERRANRALFERANFMTMVASGNQGTFIAAMKTFGEVQTMTVPRDPELLAHGHGFDRIGRMKPRSIGGSGPFFLSARRTHVGSPIQKNGE